MAYAVAMCYMLALILAVGLIVFGFNVVFVFDELKCCDHTNPIEQCRSLNPLVLPEYSVHGFLCVMFLCVGEWLTLGLNAPLLAYHVWRYRGRPVMSHPGLHDPTDVMKADVLGFCRSEASYKVVFYLLSFFYYLGRMLCCLIW